jgi:hypothetical protein
LKPWIVNLPEKHDVFNRALADLKIRVIVNLWSCSSKEKTAKRFEINVNIMTFETHCLSFIDKFYVGLSHTNKMFIFIVNSSSRNNLIAEMCSSSYKHFYITICNIIRKQKK